MLNRTALTVFLYASFLYFLKRIVFVKRHVWFFRIYIIRSYPFGFVNNRSFAFHTYGYGNQQKDWGQED